MASLARLLAAGREPGAFAAVRGDAALLADAQRLLDEVLARPEALNSGNGAGNPAVWAVVALVASGVTRERLATGEKLEGKSAWTLAGLLEEAGVSMPEFLTSLTSLFNRLLLDPELLQVTTLLKEQFTVTSVLFQKYRGLWGKLVRAEEQEDGEEDDEENSASNGDKVGVVVKDPGQRRRRALFEAGWIVFLVAKRRLKKDFAGLGQLYHLLLAALLLVASGIDASYGKLPRAQLDASPSVEAEVAAALSALGSHTVKEEADSRAGMRTRRSKRPAAASPTGEKPTELPRQYARTNAEILEALCASPRVEPADVNAALSKLKSVLHELQKNGELQVSGKLNKTGDTEPQGIGAAVLHEDVLDKNVSRLGALYAQEYLVSCGEFDERIYLNSRTAKIITGIASGLAKPAPTGDGGSTTSNLSTVEASILKSPVRRNSSAVRKLTPGSGASTPVRGMMTPPPPRHHQQPAGFTSPLRHSTGSWQWQASSSPAVTVGAANARAFLPFSSNQQYYRASPAPSSMQTPVTAAVETGHWIRDALAPMVQRPVTPELESFFADCATNPRERIAKILSERSELLLSSRRSSASSSSSPSLLATISASLEARGQAVDGRNRNSSSSTLQTGSFTMNPSSASPSSSTHSEVDGSLNRTRDLSIALFYRVLESLIRTERARLHTNDHSSLLNSEVFVSALFACCLEVLLKTHALVTLSFPTLLGTIRVRAFDFGATIESFLRHSRLPPALKHHMRDIEHRILDCLVWRSESGLYANGSDSDVPKPGALKLFFRMALSRAAARIYKLGSALGLDTKSLNQVWTAVKECVCAHQHDLMRDRHLDQVVLCSIYGVCKANKSDMTFRRVNEAYKSLQRHNLTNTGGSHAQPAFLARNLDEVIRDIKLDDRGSRGDIIKFYNRCYVPAMKVFLLQFQMQDKQLAAADVAGAAAAVSTSPVSSSSTAPPGFTPRVQGAVAVSASVSDADIVATAAAEAVEKFLATRSAQASSGSTSGTSTPPRARSQPALRSPSTLFSSVAEVQTLPVAAALRNASPQRVPSSNVYMSPLQQVRLNRRSMTLTPRSHALYAFGESPARVS